MEAAGRSRSVWFLKSIPNLFFAPRRSPSRNWNSRRRNVLNTLASVHSRRSCAFAIDRSIAWYAVKPGLTFNRTAGAVKDFAETRRVHEECSRVWDRTSLRAGCLRPAHDAIPLSRLEQDVSCFGVTFAISPGLKVVRDSGGVSTENGWTRQIWSPGAALASRKPEASDSRHFLRRRVIT